MIKEFDDAVVIEVLRNTKFKVQLLSNQNIIIASISGKIRINNIRIFKKDRVKVNSKGVIIYRYKEKEIN